MLSGGAGQAMDPVLSSFLYDASGSYALPLQIFHPPGADLSGGDPISGATEGRVANVVVMSVC